MRPVAFNVICILTERIGERDGLLTFRITSAFGPSEWVSRVMCTLVGHAIGCKLSRTSSSLLFLFYTIVKHEGIVLDAFVMNVWSQRLVGSTRGNGKMAVVGERASRCRSLSLLSVPFSVNTYARAIFWIQNWLKRKKITGK